MKNSLTRLFTFLLIFSSSLAFSQPCEWAKNGRSGINGYSALGVDVALDAQGNSYMVGIYDSVVTVLGQTAKNLFPGGMGVVLCKFDTNGGLTWMQKIDSPNFIAEGITVRGSDVIIFGSFLNNLTIGSGFGATNFSGQGTNGILLKYDTSGNYVLGRNFICPSNSYLNDVIFLNNNTVLFAGRFRQSLSIQGTPFSVTAPNNNNTFGFYGKMATDGTVDWVKISGTAGTYCEPTALALDPSGAFYLGGLYRQGLAFGSITTPAPGSTIATLPFLARFNAAGDPEWVRSSIVPGGSSSTASFVKDVKVLTGGQVMIAGGFSDRVTFLGLTSSAGHSAFAIRVQSNGNLVSSHLVESTVAGNRYDFIEQDASSNIWLGGSVKGTLTVRNNGVIIHQGQTTLDADMLLAHYQSGLNFDGIALIGSNGDDRLFGATLDATGRIFLAGSYIGNLTIAGSTFNSSGATTNDLVLARLCSFSGITSMADETLMENPPVIWPNPTFGPLQVRLSDGINGYAYQMISQQGITVRQGIINQDFYTFDLDNLPVGTYYLHWTSRKARAIQSFQIMY